jgi:2-succinyl-6-hydroxy-2,4-cyclohexadiene-1-carboxylate synthase
LIAGELDTKFTGIAHEMHPLIPNSDLVIVPNVGHAVHLEAPDTFATLVRRYIQTTIKEQAVGGY